MDVVLVKCAPWKEVLDYANKVEIYTCHGMFI